MGMGMAVIMNADSFAIFKNLANDRPLRSAIVSQAQSFQTSSTDTSSASSRVKSNIGTLLEMGLPIGWNWKSPWNKNAITNISAIPTTPGGWLLKFFGWIITGLAISLGAPFWFDMLNKVMVIRSTVKPHEKSKEEGSEDRQAS
jgi:hypothetical protein